MKKSDAFRTTIPGCIALLTFIAQAVWAQRTVEFANPNLITINTPRFPQGDGSVEPLVATPYPSTINVSGFVTTESIDKIAVTLHNLSHGTPDDIDILLVGPEGQNIVLFSDAGGGFADPGVTMTVTLDDGAEQSLPDQDRIVSGIFKPSNYEQDDDEEADFFPDEDEEGNPTPTPEPSSHTTLSIFSGTDPNGEWRLYIVDDEVFEAGSIANGWSLKIKTAPQSLPFRRGDSNQDGALDLTDAVLTLTALFLGGAQPTCADAVDADDDGFMNLADAVYTLNHLFRGGPTPPAPGPETCGVDPTDDGLACDSFLPCRSACGLSFTDCGGVCVNTTFDVSNCGGCGIICGGGETCVGTCQPSEPCVDCGGG